MMIKRISYIIFLIGLTVLMYPQVNILLVDTENRQQFVEYEKVVNTMTEEEITKNLEVFENYNSSVVIKPEDYVDPFISEVPQEENKEPLVIGKGAFGYLEIPKIQEILPIYLGATDSNLAKGVAQMDKTSLPIGGMGTNAVIAGHRGYYAAHMFRYLDQLEKGDRIYIYTFGMTLTYEVTGTEIISPYQTEKLVIDPDKDQVTLLTCTPYRISTHRLLVYTRRIGNDGRTLGRNPVQAVSLTVEAPISEEVTVESKQVEIKEDIKPAKTNEFAVSPVKEEIMIDSSRPSPEDHVDEISSVARDSKMLTYAVVSVGSVIWIVVFGMFLLTFRKKKEK